LRLVTIYASQGLGFVKPPTILQTVSRVFLGLPDVQASDCLNILIQDTPHEADTSGHGAIRGQSMIDRFIYYHNEERLRRQRPCGGLRHRPLPAIGL
jgi:hypothetical protein